MNQKNTPYVIFFVLLFVALEYFIHAYKQKKGFSFEALKDNFYIGLTQIPLGVLFGMLSYWAYRTAFAKFQIADLSGINFFLLFIIIDLAMYLLHRATHQLPLLWGMHIVHHSSSEFNLSLGLRNPWFFSLVYGFPLALFGLFGIPFEKFIMVKSVNAIFQFWVHTNLVSSVPFLDKVFVMPRHHKIHHSSDSVYYKSNYGIALIIWDKMFKTFKNTMPTEEFGVHGHKAYSSGLKENTFYFSRLLKLEKREFIKRFFAANASAPLNAKMETALLVLNSALSILFFFHWENDLKALAVFVAFSLFLNWCSRDIINVDSLFRQYCLIGTLGLCALSFYFINISLGLLALSIFSVLLFELVKSKRILKWPL